MIRLLDIGLSMLAVAILSPLLAFVALFIACTGEGDIFFVQVRSGQNGKAINVLKFATMTKDSANMAAGLFVDENDSRLLLGGAFFRATKINELPQLFNVLLGDMSLVGWRPLVEATFSRANSLSRQGTYAVKPGITSLTSVLHRREEELLSKLGDNDRNQYYFEVLLPEKVALDHWWAVNRSTWTYLLVLLLTFWVVFLPKRKAPVWILGNDVPMG
ncbi:sugar transferase [Luminiphilus sp.]|nr:sugar transferase [Luminiphilus sp.]